VNGHLTGDVLCLKTIRWHIFAIRQVRYASQINYYYIRALRITHGYRYGCQRKHTAYVFWLFKHSQLKACTSLYLVRRSCSKLC